MTAVSIAEAFERGLAHQRAGRFAEAEWVYRQILEAAPGHPEALRLLGLAAHQSGRDDAALRLIDAALAASPRHPGYHNDRGQVLHALGRRPEAIASYRRALELKPDLADAHCKLGNALKLDGRLAESVECYRRALALQPDFVEAHANFGNALYVLGDADAALAHYAHVLERFETREIRAAFAECLKGATFARIDSAPGGVTGTPDDALRCFTLRALAEAWARPADLAGACIRLIMRSRQAAECVERASNAWPQRLSGASLFGDEGFSALVRDPLLRALLTGAQVCDLNLERLLTMTREALLEHAESESIAAAGVGEADLVAFHCALAQQCYLNDYVFATTADELARVARLRDQVASQILAGFDPPAATLAAVASYVPLGSVPGVERLVGRSLGTPVAGLVAQQVTEPLEERALRERLPRLTPIEDPTSRQVRQQYEENPYPRWVKVPGGEPVDALCAYLRRLFPLAHLHGIDEQRGIDVLVAGCGTGQESIETAQQFPHARVLAVDLSLASLAYADRKTRELVVRNLEYAQADLLRLGSAGRSFDVIACAGVLHHLAEPLAGWRALVSLLRPWGLMRLGLYSARARSTVVAARRFIAQRGYAPDAADIRRCREELMSAADGEYAPLALLRDFYGIGECRDLLFHVEEHRFTLDQVRGTLAALGLRFIGFLLPPRVARRYAELNPHDPAMTDLEAWSAFENRFPATFAGMYVFWAQKVA